MPFGLCNAPATFQQEMNKILFPLIGKSVYNFIDDVLVFSKNKEDHIHDLESVFFKKTELKANLEKCYFMKPEVQVLGHQVTAEGLKPQEKKIQAIENWESPKKVHELRSFLGAIGYYRKFIDKFAQLTAPLYQLLRKNVIYKWNKKHENYSRNN